MTNKTQRVPVMPDPDLVRDDGSGIQSLMVWVCAFKLLNLGDSLVKSRKSSFSVIPV
jgi:hypothetical protein